MWFMLLSDGYQFVGILVDGNQTWGIFLILVAVTLIVLTRTIQKSLSTVVRKIRPRHA